MEYVTHLQQWKFIKTCYDVTFNTVYFGEFWPQTDQRSDDSNLQHVKGETDRNRYKALL